MNKVIMKALGFEKEVEKLEYGLCPFCNKTVKIEDFRDTKSKKEFKISGILNQKKNLRFQEYVNHAKMIFSEYKINKRMVTIRFYTLLNR